MIKIDDEYLINANESCYTLERKTKIKDTNSKNYSKEVNEMEGYYTIMFLKIQFLEGQARREMFKKYPPKFVYVNSTRQMCAMNGEFEKYNATAICYCWFIWEKGWKGEPIIRWI